MSRRSRVPKRKQLDGRHRRRNANPKLSPYQKELKRDRMANQPPVSIQKRDFPASARKLQGFLEANAQKRKQKRAERDDEADDFDENRPLEEWEKEFEPTTLELPDLAQARAQPAPAPVEDADALGVPGSASSDASEFDEEVEEESEGEEGEAGDAASASEDGTARSEVTIDSDDDGSAADEEEEEEDLGDDDDDEDAGSLDSDEEIIDTAPAKKDRGWERQSKARAAADEAAGASAKGKAAGGKQKPAVQSLNASLTVTEQDNATLKRLEKKQLASLKKREKRREERIDKLKAKGAALDLLVNRKSAKQLLKEGEIGAVADVVSANSRSLRRRKGKKAAPQADAGEDAAEGATAAANGAGAPKRPLVREERDFDDLVDHVAFGERADAPPTFDVLPTAHPALVPSQHIGKAKRAQLVEQARKAKIAAALGHGPASAGKKTTRTALPGGDTLVSQPVRNARLETADDFAALRERVMAQYAKKNQGTFNQRRRQTAFTVAGEPIDE